MSTPSSIAKTKTLSTLCWELGKLWEVVFRLWDQRDDLQAELNAEEQRIVRCECCGDDLTGENAAALRAHLFHCPESPVPAVIEGFRKENESLREVIRELYHSKASTPQAPKTPKTYGCMWCGAVVDSPDAIKKHVGTCSENPVVQKVRELEMRLAEKQIQLQRAMVPKTIDERWRKPVLSPYSLKETWPLEELAHKITGNGDGRK